MKLFRIIKNRKSIRKYLRTPIAEDTFNKIIEAGLWGPSIITVQPWKFIIVTRKSVIGKISKIILDKSTNLGVAGRYTLASTLRAVSSCPRLVAVYNTQEFSKRAGKIGKEYLEITKLAEIESIAASIQNMLLMAESLKIGSCWFSAPLFCKKELSKLFNIKDDLVGILTFGYPAEDGRRSPRKPITKALRHIK